MDPNIVSGAISTMTQLGKDEAWLQGWLKEQPTRLGLGELTLADSEPVQDDDGNPAFVATDDDRYFCVDVRLGELEASHGFGVLHNWARNRVRHPDKNHVAVLVTESTGERYRTTLEALAEHLPLVVIELQVWRGESEAILVPHIALSSDSVDLSATPAAAAASAVARTGRDAAEASDDGADGTAEAGAGPDGDAGQDATESRSDEGDEPANKDDTGIDDPWRLPKPDVATVGSSLNGSPTADADD